MRLAVIDWTIILAFLALSLAVGALVTRRAGSSATEFFLSGRDMPWWLLGVSMVATTFSTDTPNLVTDIVRSGGVAGNWVWWAFLLTGMLTTFVYARLWRRSGVGTDVEFYELRYSGRSARFLRGFRAVYLGAFFNVMIMASVTLAAIKIAGVMLGVSPLTVVLWAGTLTAIYSMLGGLTGVLVTDFMQFGLAMTGSVVAAVYALARPEVGGLARLLGHPEVVRRLSFFPDFSDPSAAMAVFVIPLAVQWWSVWYPGSEPGGGGYIAQRMLAARSEGHAQGATLLFNVAHYALRPWPWILVALSSLLVFPDLASLRAAFPQLEPRVVQNDLAYPAMLTFLPAGILGLVVASLAAAYMSTISTHLNWGASYLVHDLYRRFIRPEATQRQLVRVARVATLALMAAAGAVALLLSNALQAFQILLQIGAGTGLLFLLRWFWWRVNAAAEIAAMSVSFLVAVYFQFVHARVSALALADWQKLVAGVAVTTLAWLVTALVTRPTDDATLRRFYRATRPGGRGWEAVRQRAARDGEPLPEGITDLAAGIGATALGTLGVYAAIFATGLALYGRPVAAAGLAAVAAMAALGILGLWRRITRDPAQEGAT
jgi:Na+/proline symporter